MIRQITVVLGRISFALLLCAAALFCVMKLTAQQSKPYRTNPAECRPTDTDKCATNVIKEWDNDRWLGFIELTDAGNYHDLERMQQVLKRLGDDAHERDLLIVTYVHGWGHNAEEGDDNVTAFEALLKDMANIEASRAPSERRQVVGIYMGWRGSSVNLTPFWIPTFWSRKAVAEDIGHAAAAVFATINKVWLEANSVCRSDKRRANTRMLTIGHSFGGIVVARSVLPLMINALGPIGDVDPQADHAAVTSRLEAFGDLVVLINPAVESSAFLGLRSQLHEFPDTTTKHPSLIVVTSSADWATRLAFPLGRIFTVWDRSLRNWEEWGLMLRTIGHIDQFRTHRLQAGPGGETVFEDMTARSDWFRKELKYRRSETPFWFVKTDGSIVNGHSDFSDHLKGFMSERFAGIAKDSSDDPRPCIKRDVN